MFGRQIFNSGKLLATRGLQNQIARASHAQGGIPGEVNICFNSSKKSHTKKTTLCNH